MNLPSISRDSALNVVHGSSGGNFLTGYKIILVCSMCSMGVLLSGCNGISSSTRHNVFAQEISPNSFDGTDTERIQLAIEAATGTTNAIRIPCQNANGSNIWMIDSAVLLPGNMKVILDNCTLQLSDKSRDNMFRTDNVGHGITDPKWSENIALIGIGDVILRGANNPRATGDGARTLSLDPGLEQKKGNWRVSYGSDAGKEEGKQKGDWRNIMVLVAYVDGFKLSNVKFENSHGWTVSFERTKNVEISDIRIHNDEYIDVNGKKVLTSNKDGINLRQGCKNFRIDNISGVTGDDFIALSNLDTNPSAVKPHGDLNSTMVTSSRWYGPEDDIEQVTITNITCENRYRGIAIRASGAAGIHDILINGLIFKAIEGRYDAILLGGKGYGEMSLPGKINNIYAMNVIGNGKSLVRIEAPVHDCHFSNGVFRGESESATLYAIDRSEVKRVSENGWIKVR